ncbi:hypothetical protein PP707_00080 [Acetobacter pasteurianus]|nr:hypothetical protein [Acetobacter pasteurianus]
MALLRTETAPSDIRHRTSNIKYQLLNVKHLVTTVVLTYYYPHCH